MKYAIFGNFELTPLVVRASNLGPLEWHQSAFRKWKYSKIFLTCRKILKRKVVFRRIWPDLANKIANFLTIFSRYSQNEIANATLNCHQARKRVVVLRARTNRSEASDDEMKDLEDELAKPRKETFFVYRPECSKIFLTSRKILWRKVVIYTILTQFSQ